MKNILITGSSGFVGQNLRRYLTTMNIDTQDLKLRDSNWEYTLKNDVDAFVHLAGKAHDLRKNVNAEEYYQTNFELTRKLYDAFLRSDAKKFIFISSVKAVADKVDGVLTEEEAPNPLTHYGKSKLMAEEYIQNQTLKEGKSYYILRPCMIHGPGNKGNLNLLYKFVQKGIPYPLAAFKNKRSFLSVENLCFVITELLEKGVPSGVYQVADDEALSTNEVVCILADSLNRKPMLWPISSSLIRFVARIGDMLKFPLNSERLQKLTEDYVVSNSKIKQALASEFPLNVKQGLTITAKSFTSDV